MSSRENAGRPHSFQEKIKYLKEQEFKNHFSRDLYYNPTNYKVLSLEFIDDEKFETIKAGVEARTEEPTFYFSGEVPNERLKQEIIQTLFPKYISHTPVKKNKSGNNIINFLSPENNVINLLRGEYDSNKEKYYKLLSHSKTTVKNILKNLIINSKAFEQIEVVGRIKTFERCIAKLKKAKEANYLDDEVKLAEITDIIGIRILTFPNKYIEKIIEIIKKDIVGYKISKEDNKEEIDFYKTYITSTLTGFENIQVEIQILPYLLGKYWDIEHELIYKPQDINLKYSPLSRPFF
ncbi:hypothetical protein KJ633_01590 [bacterium]|nr:hypothetical protein [bacterium]